jgi:short-subunit dehydrogenase
METGIALVTGASSGIGEATAKRLAKAGYKVYGTSRRGAQAGQRTFEMLPLDVTSEESVEAAVKEVLRLHGRIDLLVNNAGFGAYGEFTKVSLEKLVEMTQVNVTAVVHMTHLYLPGMIARKGGDILILASTAAFQPVPYISTYAATKVFDLHFAEGLAEEVRQYGVRVCALCPGSTETEFFQVAGQRNHTRRSPETPEKVAHVGLEALAAGKTSVISGFKNWLGAETVRMVPRQTVAKITAGIFRPKEKRS